LAVLKMIYMDVTALSAAVVVTHRLML
jgi:hypothetical protein